MHELKLVGGRWGGGGGGGGEGGSGYAFPYMYLWHDLHYVCVGDGMTDLWSGLAQWWEAGFAPKWGVCNLIVFTQTVVLIRFIAHLPNEGKSYM